MNHQRAQSLGVDPTPFQRRVKATPTATVRGFEAQVNGRRDNARGEHRVADLEERVGAPIEAAVERAAEGTQIVKGRGGIHDDGFCSAKPSAATFTVPPLPGWLKHKLRKCVGPHTLFGPTLPTEGGAKLTGFLPLAEGERR